MFIFPIGEFAAVIRKAEPMKNNKYRVFISKTHEQPVKWYLRRRWGFSELDAQTVLDVTPYYRNFACLG